MPVSMQSSINDLVSSSNLISFSSYSFFSILTIYLTLIIIRLSSRVLPKEINPNHYLPVDIPGIEILITIEINISFYYIFSIVF